MERRQFLQSGGLAVLGSALPATGAAATPRLARHLGAAVVSAPDLPAPQGVRAPFGWKTATVAGAGHEPLRLSFPELSPDNRPSRLRLAVALDERDEKLVECFLAKSGRLIGTFDIRFPSQFQIHEIALEKADLAELRLGGIGLRVTKGSDLEVFTGGDDLPPELRPHLLVEGSAPAPVELLARLANLSCVQPFGWMEGCVMDGLHDLSAVPAHAGLKEAEARHLALFFKNGRLVYENVRSAPSDGKLYGIEGGLPFAALARRDPLAAPIDSALEFWRSRQDAEGAIIDDRHTSSEGCYTVAYPLAVIGKGRGDGKLQELALTQLRVRQRRLFDGRTFWRTHDPGDPPKLGNRNWARGIAWQLLGFARTLRVLKERADLGDLIGSFRQLAALTLEWQRADGLWSVFADDMKLTPDTGGSAGIATALAIGANEGWLGNDARAAAVKAHEGLLRHLTPDGLLGGVSQANKGGEGLQRGDYRVIYQMAMGLVAQLQAALARPVIR